MKVYARGITFLIEAERFSWKTKVKKKKKWLSERIKSLRVYAYVYISKTRLYSVRTQKKENVSVHSQ